MRLVTSQVLQNGAIFTRRHQTGAMLRFSYWRGWGIDNRHFPFLENLVSHLTHECVMDRHATES